MTAPHGPSQQAVIVSAIVEANMTVAELAGLEMHGTGTPLGDPIEVGAASTALQSPGRALQLSAAKSIIGHAEPAAGSVGLAHAISIVTKAQVGVMPHVRAVNAHVTSLFDNQGKIAVIAAARQAASRICTDGCEAMGVSAFAFQGTNAHAIVRPTEQIDEVVPSSPVWSRARYWYAARSTASLFKASCSIYGHASFQTRVTKSALAFLMDHQVQGVALFPGSGMFDAACSACTALSAEPSRPFALIGASIAAPLPMEAIQDKILMCDVRLAAGAVEVQSQTGSQHYQSHLRAGYGRIFASPKFYAVRWQCLQASESMRKEYCLKYCQQIWIMFL